MDASRPWDADIDKILEAAGFAGTDGWPGPVRRMMVQAWRVGHAAGMADAARSASLRGLLPGARFYPDVEEDELVLTDVDDLPADTRIVVDHNVMGGLPCVAGTRIPVATVVGLVANGLSVDDIRRDYSQLTREDVQACLAYAARAVDETRTDF